jgi:3-deoxy-manno-octulosonate cytidylyltransferase (CMP-KDO synthetase)
MSSPLKIRVAGVIPARLNSERLPGKVLRPLAGKAMLHHVYDAARSCSLLDELWVATDAEAVREYCVAHHIPVLMTAGAHRSGTERIREAMEKIPADVFLNLQGDEPLLTATHVQQLIAPFLSDPSVQVTTLKAALDASAVQNPNIVKVVTDTQGKALYFSRAAIPYWREGAATPRYFKHLGLYGYRRQALLRYATWSPTPLEQIERLEQLRFLENGIPIYVAETQQDTIGVDTEEDWNALTRYLEDRARQRCAGTEGGP